MCLCLLAFVPLSSAQQIPDGFPVSTFPFTSQPLIDATVILPTSLQFGPDNRLYVSERDGLIDVFTVARFGDGEYRATAVETIDLIRRIQNHDDSGQPNFHQQRLVTGILVTGTAERPEIYVTSSDYREGWNQDVGVDVETRVDSNSGILSRLSWRGDRWERVDLVRGLPRSANQHATNGMALAEDGILYVAQGGVTNMGAPFTNLENYPEMMYSAAILTVDLKQITTPPFDLPTLDDPDRPGGNDENDPFGGNRGKNQAIITSDSPVQIFASGFRNPYDLVLTQAGQFYTTNNGANSGWGGYPLDCTDTIRSEVYPTDLATIHHITLGYYAGHPNPARAAADPRQCNYIAPADTDAQWLWEGSLNGIVEYTASNFDGALQGDLLVADYYGNILRMLINDAGDQIESGELLFTQFGNNPVDITAVGDEGGFPGTIWVAVIGSDRIQVFEPGDYAGGTILDPLGQVLDPSGDEDEDGFTNADELDNGTNPYSQGQRPSDVDNDGVSDQNDLNDDNDALSDLVDRFPLDPDDGAATTLPLTLTFDAGGSSGILGTGFTGLMTNGGIDYARLYDAERIIPGAAVGLLTIENIASGADDAARNTQRGAFQVGFTHEGAFTAQARIAAPFFDGVPAQPDQSIGFFIGTGDQDNYAKIVLNAVGLQVMVESGGQAVFTDFPLDLLDLPSIDLYLMVGDDGGLRAGYRAPTDEIVLLGEPQFPTWLQNRTVLAVGVIATSPQSTPFTGIWDFIDVRAGE